MNGSKSRPTTPPKSSQTPPHLPNSPDLPFKSTTMQAFIAADIAAVLRQCSTVRHLKSVHAAVLRSDLHCHVSSDLVSHYAHFGSPDLAETLLVLHPDPHPAPWNALLRAYADHGPASKALEFYRRMHDAGVVGDSQTYSVAVKVCSQIQDLEEGERVRTDAERLGFGFNVAVVNALIGMYGKCGNVENARRLFDGMRVRSVVSWSAIIGAYAHNGMDKEAFGLFSRMLAEGVQPNRGAFLNVMACVMRGEDADNVYKLVSEDEIFADGVVRNAVVRMFGRCGTIEMARKVFDETIEKHVTLWNSMIDAYARNGLPMEGLSLFGEMMEQGVQPDYGTLYVVIGGCSRLASLRFARSVHGIVLKSLAEHSVGLENSLVDLYAKCGGLKFARRLFNHMVEKDTASWNTMIHGYGMNCMGKDALELFDEMKISTEPDDRTLVSVMTACCNTGLLDEGQKLFDSMDENLSIAPKNVHYACMVDLMGRAGKVKEALDFVKSLPIEPDSCVWSALLSACRANSNIEIAEVAAKSILDLDPDNSRAYVILSNIYKFWGKHEETDRIGALMNERGVEKPTGCSFVVTKYNVFKFLTGDRSKPQTDEIYNELDKLMENIKKEGYVPDTNLVLHDIEEETKEDILHALSEKLAIVFGQLNTEPENEIMVHKNGSICADSYKMAKFVSKVTGRVIVIRDSNMFHHFKDGISSSGDYW